VPAPPLNLLRRGVEYVEDVRGFAVADLDAEGVDQNEPVEPMTALDGELGRKPPAEGQSDQGHLLVGQRLEEVEIEVDEVVHGLEIRRARRSPEAGVGGGDDLGVMAEHF